MSQIQKGKEKKKLKPHNTSTQTPPLQRIEKNTPNQAAFKWRIDIDSLKAN